MAVRAESQAEPGVPDLNAGASMWLTIGHSTHPIEAFLEILQAHAIQQLVDVRTAPGSRKNPQFNRAALARSLARHCIDYRHMPGLGGFRKPSASSLNTGWENASFRGFADYMQTDNFVGQLDELIDVAAQKRTVMMCSEAVPWRCHRSLIADALAVRGIAVEHILSATRRDLHRLTPFAEVDGTQITYPSHSSREGQQRLA